MDSCLKPASGQSGNGVGVKITASGIQSLFLSYAINLCKNSDDANISL